MEAAYGLSSRIWGSQWSDGSGGGGFDGWEGGWDWFCV